MFPLIIGMKSVFCFKKQLLLLHLFFGLQAGIPIIDSANSQQEQRGILNRELYVWHQRLGSRNRAVGNDC